MLCVPVRIARQTCVGVALLLGACVFVPRVAIAASNHLNQLNCAADQIAKYDGNNWVCSADEGADITALEARVTALGAALAAETAAREAADTALQAAIDLINANTVLTLDGSLSLDESDPTRPAALFEEVVIIVEE